MRALPGLLGIATLLAACAPYADVREKQPSLAGASGLGPLADAEQAIGRALHRDHVDPLKALGDCLGAMEIALRTLRQNPESAPARRDYNFALGRVFEIIHEAGLNPWTQPLHVPGPSGGFLLTYSADPHAERHPSRCDFTPADQFDVRGRYVSQRVTRAGLGAPLVAIERDIHRQARESFAPSRLFYGLTGVAQFQGRRCVLALKDPLADETTQLDGHTYALAADFTAPLAVMLEKTDPKKHELSRLLNPEKFAHTAAIERLQPYDPNKTIVLVIHGLMDSQATWIPMINALRGEPLIRKHYQFWFYSYPSGYPYPYSAAILREELDAVEKRFPARKPMVVIGHSMGGCISRLLITDSGDRLWMTIFGRPPNEVPLSAHTRAYFEEELFFHHRPEIGRVIFIAAPLRGSDLASGWFGQLAASFIHPAKIASQASQEMLRLTSVRENELKPKRRANSVDTLSPKSRFVNAINTIPIMPGIPYDTIIGDRGRHDSPNSSDGVVPYWSSHLDGAEIEDIVPSSHTAHQNPQAIAEVLHILKIHALQ